MFLGKAWQKYQFCYIRHVKREGRQILYEQNALQSMLWIIGQGGIRQVFVDYISNTIPYLVLLHHTPSHRSFPTGGVCLYGYLWYIVLNLRDIEAWP